MLRISKLTDYATVILAALAEQPEHVRTATALAEETRILDALEGPVALTECSAGHGNCDIEATCRVGRVWQRLNLAIRRSLYEVSLAQLAGLDSTQVRLPELEREMKTAATRVGRSGANRHE
jgi:DNA-binding IscR family transcriptional regulator